MLSLILLALAGCEKLDKLTQFEMPFDTSVDIPSTIGINLPFNIITPNITTNSESTFESNNTNKDLIEKVVLKSMALIVEKPNGEDFSFLKSIKITIKADNLGDKIIAWNNDVPSNTGDSLLLETSPDNLKDYILKDSYKLDVETVTDEILTQDYTIKIHSVFFVDAKILGI